MEKYHLDPSGTPVVCPAKTRCRLNGRNNPGPEHFYGTKKDALVWAEKMNQQASGHANSAIGVGKSKPKTKPKRKWRGGFKKATQTDANKLFGSGELDAESLEVTKEKIHNDSTHYQELWVQSNEGTNAVYAKINRRVWSPGEVYSEGVVLCNLEVNPQRRGKGDAIDFLRLVKDTYGVDVVYSSSSFSSDGYKFFERVQQHEKETGERLMDIAPGTPVREAMTAPREGTEYSFVDDWTTKKSSYGVD